MVLVTVIAVLATAVVIAVNLKPKPGPTGGGLLVPPMSYATDLVSGDALGKADAPVRLEIWSDFQCPICARLAVEQMPTLVTRFVNTGLLRIESRDIAILGTGTPDESLELATGAVCAARQNRYWPFHDLVFWNQGRENRGDHSNEFIARVATAAEVDMTAWNSCTTKTELAQAVVTRTTDSAAAGIRSTPTLRINGQVATGVPDYNQLHALITQLLASYSPSPSNGPSASPAASPAAS